MSWEDVTVPKPRRGARHGLGANALTRGGKVKPLTHTEVDAQVRLAHHGSCIEHVAVEGLREPVCIRRGDDRAAVLAAVRELLR